MQQSILQVEDERVYSGSQSVMVEKTWQEAAGHSTNTVRKERKNNVGAGFSFPFLFSLST